MKNCTEVLLELAKQVLEIYKTCPTIKAIAIGASISKNQATEYSDLDLMLIYDELPDQTFLEMAFKHNEGINRNINGDKDNGFLETYYLKGIECQLSHSHFNFYESVVEEVIVKHTSELLPHLVADGLQTVIPIHGFEYINDLKERLNNYPRELTISLLNRFMRFGPFDELRYRFQKEENIIWSTDVISILIKRILGTLIAVNKQYIPGDFRKVNYVIDKLEIKPDNLYKKILEIYSNPPEKILETLNSLIVDTFFLVEENVPEYDITEIKKIFFEPHPRLKEASE